MESFRDFINFRWRGNQWALAFVVAVAAIAGVFVVSFYGSYDGPNLPTSRSWMLVLIGAILVSSGGFFLVCWNPGLRRVGMSISMAALCVAGVAYVLGFHLFR